MGRKIDGYAFDSSGRHSVGRAAQKMSGANITTRAGLESEIDTVVESMGLSGPNETRMKLMFKVLFELYRMPDETGAA